MNGSDDAELGRLWIDELRAAWGRNKDLADAAIAQLTDEQLHQALAPELNSVAVVMKHVGGNLRSRWSDLLTSDGEKPDRNRDEEFVDDPVDRDTVVARWEAGWSVLFEQLGALAPDDARRRVVIRGESLSVPHAALRSITHCAYHVGQIVQTARALVGDRWEPLTIAPGESEAYNRRHWGNA